MSEVFKLGAVVSLQNMATDKLRGLQGSFDSLRKKLGETNKDLIRFEKGVSNLKIGGSLLALGGGMAMGLSAVVEPAMSLNVELATLKGTANATKSEMDAFRKSAMEAGMKTQWSPDEAVQGLTALAASGMNANEAMKTLLPTLDLATSAGGKLTIADAAKGLSSVMNAFKVDTKDANYVTGVFNRMTQLSSFEIQDLSQAFRGVNMAAPAANQSLEETSAVMMAIKTMGGTAADAGDKMRMSLRALQTPSRLAKREIESLGLQLRDQNGKMRPLSDMYDELAAKTSHLSNKDREAKLAKILHAEGLAGFNAVMGLQKKVMKDGIEVTLKGTDVIRYWKGELTNARGTTEKFARTQEATFKGATKIFQGVKKTLMTTIGNTLLPLLTKGVQALTWITEKTIAFAQAHPKLTKFIGTFALLATGASLLAGTFLVLKGAFLAFVAAVNIGLISNPFGWVIIGVAAAIAGIAALITYWDDIKEAGVASAKWIQTTWNNTGQWFSDLWAGIKNGVLGIWTKIKSVWSGMPDWLRGLIGVAALIITGPFGVAAIAVIKYWDDIKLGAAIAMDWIQLKMDQFGNLVSTKWNQLGTFLGGIWDSVAAKWERGIQFIKDLIPGWIKGVFSGFDSETKKSGMKFNYTFAEGVKSAESIIPDSVLGILSKIGRFLPHSDAEEGPLSQLTKSGRDLVGTFVYGMESAKHTVKPAIVDVVSETGGTSMLSRAWEGLKNLGTTAIQKVGEGINKAKGIAREAGNALMQTFGEGIQKGKDLLDNAFGESLEAGIGEQLPHSNAKRGPLSNLTGSGASLLNTLSDGMEDFDPGFYALLKNTSPANQAPITSQISETINNSKGSTVNANKLVEVNLSGTGGKMDKASLIRLVAEALSEQLELYEAV